MKATFKVSDFADAARAVRGISAAKNALDILDHAQATFTAASLTLKMSDMDMEGMATVPCEADEPACICLPRGILDFFVARAAMDPDGEGAIVFDEDSPRITATQGRGRIVLGWLRGEDFPSIPEPEADWTVTARADAICRAMQIASAACYAGKHADGLFDSTFFYVNGDDVGFFGSNKARTHRCDINGAALEGAMPAHGTLTGVLVAPKSVREILRAFAGDESEIVLTGTDRVLVARGSRIELRAKLMTTIYPDFTRLQLDMTGGRITVDRARLLAAVEGLGVIRYDKVPPSTVVALKDGELHLSVSGNAGDIEDAISAAADGVDGDWSGRFKADFLVDALKCSDRKDVSIVLSVGAEAAGRPVQIDDGDDTGTQFIITQQRF